MQKVAQIVERTQPSKVPSSKSQQIALQQKPLNRPDPLKEHWVAAIFERLRARYPTKWPSRFGPTPGDTAQEREAYQQEVRLQTEAWASRLGRYKPENIGDALEQWDGEFPPDLAEFEEACKASRSRRASFYFQAPGGGTKAGALEGIAGIRRVLVGGGR